VIFAQIKQQFFPSIAIGHDKQNLLWRFIAKSLQENSSGGALRDGNGKRILRNETKINRMRTQKTKKKAVREGYKKQRIF
jgi:hypothetical protein